MTADKVKPALLMYMSNCLFSNISTSIVGFRKLDNLRMFSLLFNPVHDVI